MSEVVVTPMKGLTQINKRVLELEFVIIQVHQCQLLSKLYNNLFVNERLMNDFWDELKATPSYQTSI